jgi:hypothetical protein
LLPALFAVQRQLCLTAFRTSFEGREYQSSDRARRAYQGLASAGVEKSQIASGRRSVGMSQ